MLMPMLRCAAVWCVAWSVLALAGAAPARGGHADGEVLLGAVVLLQLGYRLFYGAPNAGLLGFGDSLSQYLAQIGRFGTFNSDEKPWPFADWPTPQAPQGETPHSIPAAAHPVRDEEPKL